jgi:mono/diheme cytochrome c family protein
MPFSDTVFSPSLMLHRRTLLSLGLLVAAGVGVAAAPPRAEQPRTGQQIYASTCAACHQPGGEGNGETYPPLAGSEWVTGPEHRLALVILHGLTGEIEVQGQSYSGVMPPWGAMLKDEEVAALATYLRSSWGNKAAPVTAATVAQLRAAHASRTTMWTAAELARVAIPVRK